MEIESFKRSLKALELELTGGNSKATGEDRPIKKFIHVYGLAIEVIKQYLEKSSSSPSEIEYLSFEQMIRRAYTTSIISEELRIWKQFRTLRNNAAHGNEINTDQSETIIKFLDEARYLLVQLNEREKYLE